MHASKSKTMSVFSSAIMCALSWGAEFYLFNWANDCEIEYHKDMASIRAGEFTEHEYRVARKYIQKSKDSPDSHMVQFEGPQSFYRDVGSEHYDKISCGETIAAKHVNGKVWIDELDSGPYSGQGKWFLLGLGFTMGLVPMAMASYDVLSKSN
jgi:hypothetical protein